MAASHKSSLYIAQYPTERLIIASRLVLASFSILATGLDPIPTSPHADPDSLLRMVYLGFAGALVFLSWQRYHIIHRIGLITHLFDLAVLGLLLLFATTLADYLYVHMLFPVVAASLRWGWRGMLWTLLVVMLAYMALALSDHWSPHGQPPAELTQVAVYLPVFVGHLLAVAMLLGYLAHQYAWSRQEIIRLADWPRDIPEDSLSNELVRTVATIFRAPRIIMIWDEPDEPWLNLTYFHNGHVLYSRESPTSFQPLVATALQESHFLCPDVRGKKPVLVHDDHHHQRHWHGSPLNNTLRRQYNISSVLALRLRTDPLDGWLFVLDKEDMTADDLLLGEIVTRQVTTDMSGLYRLQRPVPQLQSEFIEDGVALARNLHDGLLQNLTSIALKLQAAQTQLGRNPEAARVLLQDLQQAIVREQSELRTFVERFKPFFAETVTSGSPKPLPERLRELTRRISRDWPTLVEVAFKPAVRTIPIELNDELYYIVQEALTNAARHSQCTRIHLAMDVRDGNILLSVEDDGRGFPFQGRYDLAALKTMRQGPVSLGSRISQLGGNLVVYSSTSGSRLDVHVPLASATAFQNTELSNPE